MSMKMGMIKGAAVTLGVVGALSLTILGSQISADEPSEPATDPGTDTGAPLNPTEEDGETENVDSCESGPTADKKGGEEEPDPPPEPERGAGAECMMDGLMNDFAGLPRGGSSGLFGGSHGGGSASAPGPDDEDGDDPAGDGEGKDGTGKKEGQDDSSNEDGADPEGGNSDGVDGGTSSSPIDDPDDGSTGAEGSEGETGGGDEGDGANDNKGGDTDGEVNVNCQSASAGAQLPGGVNPNPVGGAEGVNPGFLNPVVQLRYRSVQATQHYTGIGWDANVFERLVVFPTQNPSAEVAWYPGDGSVHYFFPGPAGALNLIGEPAVQDTHTIQVNQSQGAQYKYILVDKHGNKSYFRANGTLGYKEDVFGKTNVYTRDPVTLRLTSISSSYGHPSLYTMAYHATGRLASITDHTGRVTTFSYDANSHLTQIAFPASTLHPTGKKFQYTYYGSTGNPSVDGKIKSIIDPNGVTRVDWVYNAQGLVTELRRGNASHSTTITASGATRDVVDFNGNTRRYTFLPNLHYPTKVELFTRGLRPGDPASFVWQYSYNPQRQITQAVLPSGKTYNYTYDSAFNLVQKSIVAAGGAQTAVHSWTYGSLNHRTSYTDPLGKTWSYLRDSQGMLTSVQVPTIAGESYSFGWAYNSSGQVTSVTNTNGATLSLTRYTSGPQKGWLQSATVSSTSGNGCEQSGLTSTYTFTHNERGWPMTMTDPAGNTIAYTRDALDRVTKVTSGGSVPQTASVEYNNLGLPSAATVDNFDENGVRDPVAGEIGRYFVYDHRRRIVGVTEDFATGVVRTTALSLDGLGNITQLTTPSGRTLSRAWDERGLPLSSTTGVTAPRTHSFSYHLNGQLASTTDPLNNTTIYNLDIFGRPAEIVRPTGEKFAKVYDLAGRTVEASLRDAGGVLASRQTFAYDVRNRVTSQSYDYVRPGQAAQVGTLSIEYDEAGNVKKRTFPNGVAYDNTFLPCGRLLSSTNTATGSKIEYAYDKMGRVIQVKRTETEGGTTKVYEHEASYDYMGRIIETREIDADDPTHVLTSNFRYDSRSLLKEVVGAVGTTTKFEYNYAGYLTKEIEVVDPGLPSEVEHTTTYEWSLDGKVLSMTDPTGAKTSYAYDEHGALVTTTLPDTTQVSYTYDAAGRVATVTDANGTIVTNTYDANGRLTQRGITKGTGILGTTSETYSYDVAGRLKSATDDDSVVEFDYDSAGNVIEERQGPSVGSLVAVQSTYDVQGALTQRIYPTTQTLDYSVDSAGRFSGISVGGASMFSRSYARTYLPVSSSYFASGAVEGGGFDGFDRIVTQSVATPSSGTPFDVQYGYDDAHDRLYEKRLHQGTVGDLFTYDQRRRLSQAMRGVADPVAELNNPGSQTFSSVVTYNYDAAGARTSVATTPAVGTPTNVAYTSNSLHQYLLVGGVARTYDAAGSLTGDGTYSYAYDYRGNLVEVRAAGTGAVVAVYTYDALGRRTSKMVVQVPPTPPISEQYIYAGDDLVEVRDGSGAMLRQYVYGADVDEAMLLFAIDSNDVNGNSVTSEYLWFGLHRDARNSVRLVTDASGGVVESYEYDEFGGQTIKDATGTVIAASRVGNTLTFTSREWDAETGLLFFRARHYDPATGTFLQRDPLGYVDGPSLYTYAQNSPISRIDPFGTDDIPAPKKKSSGLWDAIATGLDVIGMTDIPIVSQVAELGSAAMSLAEGDLAGAGLSVAAMVPGVGSGATMAKIARRADKVADLVKGADKIGDGAKALDKASDASKSCKAAGKSKNANKTSGETSAAKRGREAHQEFAEKVKAKEGWQSEPQHLVDPKTGKKVIPDALDSKGRPIELKPNTASGRKKGKTQLKKYERATGKRGRLIFYEP